MAQADSQGLSNSQPDRITEPDLTKGLVLVLDTAGCACQVALYVNGQCAEEVSSEMTYGQAEWLIPLVQNVMKASEYALKDLSAVIVTVGPGSFTGLRVGLAAAQGFGLAANCPVFGVSSLAAWAMSEIQAETSGQSSIRVVLDSRRSDAFIQDFSASGQAISAPCIVSAADAKRQDPMVSLIGDLVGDLAAPSLAGIYAAALLPDHRVAPHPLYLREADAVPSMPTAPFNKGAVLQSSDPTCS